MARKVRPESRCPGCGLPPRVCYCAGIPRCETRTKVVVVMHWRETLTTSNTGRFVKAAVVGAELRLRGLPGAPLTLGDLETNEGSLLYLFPSESARVLEHEWVESLPGPVTLVVPDGTWRQARRVQKREAALSRAIPVKLPPVEKSTYWLRSAPRASCLSTLEATARALGILEPKPRGREIEASLLGLFEEIVRRQMALKPPERVEQRRKKMALKWERGEDPPSP